MFFLPLSDDNKYIGINLHESGRIEYKIKWKEENKLEKTFLGKDRKTKTG